MNSSQFLQILQLKLFIMITNQMLKFILENEHINREFMETVYHFEANNTPFDD